MKLFIIFIFLFSFNIFSNEENCYIETAPKIYFSKTQKKPIFIKDSNCNKKIQKQFNLFILSTNGLMRADDVERILFEQFNKKVTITPEKIKTYDFSDFIKESFSLSSNWNVSNIELLDDKPLLVFDEDTKVTAICADCDFTGSKQIKLEIKNDTNNKYFIRWVKADIKVKTKALVLKRSLTFTNQPLSEDDFTLTYVQSDRPEKLFTNKKTLKYYKINKKLAKNSPLKMIDLSPVNLVRAGRQVDIMFENTNLKLKTKASPLSMGNYGDIIQLRNNNNNRIIVGKVVDYNKVLVEL